MYPTIVTALIYSQRSISDNYDLGIVSSTSPRITNATPPMHDTCSSKLATNDTVQTTHGAEDEHDRMASTIIRN